MLGCVYVCPANKCSSGAGFCGSSSLATGFDVTINGGSTSKEKEILKKTREEDEALLGSCGLIHCKAMYMNCNQHHCVETQLYYLQCVVASRVPTSPNWGEIFLCRALYKCPGIMNLSSAADTLMDSFPTKYLPLQSGSMLQGKSLACIHSYFSHVSSVLLVLLFIFLGLLFCFVFYCLSPLFYCSSITSA